MKAVSLFDSLVAAIRDARFTRSEALEIMQELQGAYPDVMEQAGIDSQFPTDFRERLVNRGLDEAHMNDAAAGSDEEAL
jgi:hypothetical protein